MSFYIPKKIKLNSIFTGIICGGIGSRLKALNKNIPKLFTTIIDKKNFYDFFIKKKIHNIKNKNTLFFFDNNAIYRDKIIEEKLFYLICEKKKLGTAGALVRNLKYFRSNFIIFYGDIFFEDDLRKIFNYHKLNNNDITIHVHKKKNIKDVNLISINQNNLIDKVIFNKSGKINKILNLCLGGIYVFKKKFLINFIKNNKKIIKNKIDLEKFLFKDPLIFKKSKIDYYLSKDYLTDFGTPKRLLELRNYLKYKKKKKKRIYLYLNLDLYLIQNLHKKLHILRKKNNERFNYIFILNITYFKFFDKLKIIKKIDSYLSKFELFVDEINFVKNEKL